MIFIDRYRADEHGAPIAPSAEWFEAAEAARDQAIADGAGHQVVDTYKDAAVRRALEELFHDKCAYCESSTIAGADWDVEHYRPKGAVAERADHPGYYWLAYDWENLYPSCQHCNQKRRDQARWGDTSLAPGPAAGKLDQFPLDDEAARAMTPGDPIEHELPLLLDPNLDDPALYLTFDPQGDIVAIDDDLFATATIAICHLRRKRLRDARARVVLRVAKLIENIGKADAAGETQAAAAMRTMLEDHYCADACEYAAVARAVRDDPTAFGVA